MNKLKEKYFIVKKTYCNMMNGGKQICCIDSIGSGKSGGVKIILDDVTGELNVMKTISFLKENSDLLIKEFNKEVYLLQLFSDHNFFPKYVDSKIENKTDRMEGKIITRYHCGSTLTKIITNIGDLPLNIIKLYITKLLKAVKLIHKTGYFNLDIKADNIIIEPTGNLIFVDLDSFIHNESKYEDKHIIYTQNYAAPEIMRKQIKNIGFTCDIWSIGILALNMFIGKELQFEILDILNNNDNKKIDGIIESNINENNKDKNLDFISFVKKCLMINPNERFQNIDNIFDECQFFNVVLNDDINLSQISSINDNK